MKMVSFKSVVLFSVAGIISTGAFAVEGEPAGRVGRAVIAALTPHATATYPDKTAHDYPKGHLELREGMALSEMHSINTDVHGRMCMVLTPGAMLCVRPSTAIKLDRLQKMTDGLPETGKDLQRRIELTLSQGAILVYAGPPSASMTIQVSMPVGKVEARGGEFIVMQDKGDWLVGGCRDGLTVVTGDSRTPVAEGELFRFSRNAAGKVSSKKDEGSVESYRNQFDVCREFLPELGRLVFLPNGVDLGGVQAWIDTPGGIEMVGDPLLWSDVTPSRKSSESSVTSRTPAASERSEGGELWTEDQIWDWYRKAGTIKGANYISRTAVNPVEFFQEQTFNPKAIDEELKWANEAGFNSVRVVLSYPVWSADPQGFKDRLKKVLEIADTHHLTVVPVLFDDLNVAGRDPVLGKQPEPVPGTHNSQWTPSPGRKVVEDKSSRANLEKYVRDITGTLYRDKRVLFWDLYNAPGAGGMGEKSLQLLESTFLWAREEGCRQPMTAAVWGDASDPMSMRLMELSDLITFQSFDNAAILKARLLACEPYKRPIICSDWLKRQAGNTFADVLPVLSEQGVGWYSRGLVRGRAQLYIPDDQKVAAGTEPKVWQQDVLWADGKPYDRTEVDLIKAYNYSR